MCVWALLSWAGTLFSVSMGTRVEYLIKQKKKRVHYKYRKFFFIKMSKTHTDSFAEFMQSFFIFDTLYVSEFVFWNSGVGVVSLLLDHLACNVDWYKIRNVLPNVVLH